MSETGLHTRPRGWELLLAVIRWFLIITVVGIVILFFVLLGGKL